MTLDLSLLPARRRRPIVERYEREVVATLAASMYEAYKAAHGATNAPAEIAAALVADGHRASVATERFVRAAVKEGR